MKIILLDTETTGRGENDRLVQLAYKCGDVMENLLFKPPIPISFEAMAVHHITNEMVENCPPFSDPDPDRNLQQLFNEGVVVAHNAPFDIAMLEREGLKVPRYIDTLKICQHLFDESQYKLQYLRYKYDLKIEGRAHDAEGDVLVLEALFKYVFTHFPISKMELELTGSQAVFERVINDMIELSQKPVLLRRINFGKHKGMPFAEIPKDYLRWLKDDRMKKPPEQPDPDLDYTLDYYLNTDAVRV